MHPITEPEFVTPDHTVYNFTGDPIWTKSIGNELCIFDSDDRPFNEEGQIWGEEPFSWDGLKGTTPGILNHFLYGRGFFSIC